MPFGSISKARLAEVHPVLALKIQKLEQMLNEEGIDIAVVQGLRSWNQQQALFEQGRTQQPDGTWVVADKSKVVTNCPGGWSWHNFGLACDCAPDDPTKPGYQADWNAEHPAWKRMEAIGISLGLTSGSAWRSFPDNPHFQLTGRFGVNPDDEVRQVFKDGGLKAIWDEAQIPTGDSEVRIENLS